MLIGAVILVFVGPDRIPELMSVAGRYYGKVRRMSDDLRRAFNAEVARSESDRRRVELEARRKEVDEKRRAERESRERAAEASEREPAADSPANVTGSPESDSAPDDPPAPAPSSKGEGAV
jgi:sec-independent protein translocase protein TatB